LDEKSSRNGGIPPDCPGNRFFNPFNPVPAAGFVPSPDAAAASDDTANFSNRFGSWAAKPFGEPGNVGNPATQPAVIPGRRSDIPDNVTPTSVQATPSAWSLLAADASGIGGVLKYANAAPAGTTTELPLADPNDPGFSPPGSTRDDNLPERRLARRTVNPSSPTSGDAPPLAPAAASPALGIFSGQPMPDWPVPPPIWGFSDKAKSSEDDDEWYKRIRQMLGN
jgi:hypothetical protein